MRKKPDRLASIEKTMRSMGALVESHDRAIASIGLFRKQLEEALGVVKDFAELHDAVDDLNRWRAKNEAERTEYETYKRLRQKFG